MGAGRGAGNEVFKRVAPGSAKASGGVFPTLSPPSEVCGGLSASGPKATTGEPGPGPPQPAQGCDGWSPGAGAARGCTERARGAQGALGRAGLGGSRGESQRPGRRLNVKSKKG